MLMMVLAAILLQTGPSRSDLRGLDRVTLLVDVSADAGLCGVQGEALQAAASEPLRDAKIRVEDNAPVSVSVKASVIQVGSACFANIAMSVRTIGSAVLAYGSSDPRVGVLVVLWENETVRGGPAVGFGQRVEGVIRDFAEQFTASVRLANQR